MDERPEKRQAVDDDVNSMALTFDYKDKHPVHGTQEDWDVLYAFFLLHRPRYLEMLRPRPTRMRRQKIAHLPMILIDKYQGLELISPHYPKIKKRRRRHARKRT